MLDDLIIEQSILFDGRDLFKGELNRFIILEIYRLVVILSGIVGIRLPLHSKSLLVFLEILRG
jgi:hypothetical protein